MAQEFDYPDDAVELAGDSLSRTEDPADQGDETLEEMIARVCRHFGVDAADLRSPRRVKGLSAARAVISFLGVARLGCANIRKMGRRDGSQDQIR